MKICCNQFALNATISSSKIVGIEFSTVFCFVHNFRYLRDEMHAEGLFSCYVDI